MDLRNPEVELRAKVDIRSDGLQRNPEVEISSKMRKNYFKREPKQCNSNHYSKESSKDSQNSELGYDNQYQSLAVVLTFVFSDLP